MEGHREDFSTPLASALRRHVADDLLGCAHAAGIGLQETEQAAAEAKPRLREVHRVEGHLR